MKELIDEKNKFIDKPMSHPKYKNEWHLFWTKKYNLLGKKPEQEALIPEWRSEWLAIMEKEYEKKMTEKSEELKQKWGFSTSSKKVPEKKKTEMIITLSEDSDDEIQELTVPPPPIMSTPSTSKVSSDIKIEAKEMKSDFKNPEVKKEKKSKPQSYAVPQSQDDLNVYSLLKILSALHSKGLLLNLGDQISKMKESALALEDMSHGSSQMMLNDDECFNVMDQTAETLNHKLSSGQVPEIHKKVVQLAVNQIQLFLSKSTCHKNEILEIESFSPIRPEALAETKMKIANTIEQQLIKCSKRVTQEEFNKLVEAEFVRVKYKLPSNKPDDVPQSFNKIQPPLGGPGMPSLNLPTPSSSTSSIGDMFSAYIQPPHPSNVHVPHHLPGIQSLDQRPNINWDEIIRAMKSIKEQHEQKMQPPIARSSDQAIVHPSAGTFSHSLFNPSIPGTSRQAMANSPINHGSRQPQSQSNLLSDEELISLIKNVKQLPETMQRDLIVMMKDLEKVDPEKSERIRKKLIDSRGK